jgi:hypothetical protein
VQAANKEVPLSTVGQVVGTVPNMALEPLQALRGNLPPDLSGGDEVVTRA